MAIPTGVNLLRVASSRHSIIEIRVEKLERKQAKALEAPADNATEKSERTKPEPDDA